MCGVDHRTVPPTRSKVANDARGISTLNPKHTQKQHSCVSLNPSSFVQRCRRGQAGTTVAATAFIMVMNFSLPWGSFLAYFWCVIFLCGFCVLWVYVYLCVGMEPSLLPPFPHP